MQGSRVWRLLGYAFLSAVVAYMLCFVASYGLTKYKIGFFSGDEELSTELATFKKAALNLYAIGHVKLSGSGETTDITGGTEHVSADILLPYSIWTFIPFITFFLALQIMTRTNREMESRHGFYCAALVAFFYAAISVLGAIFVQANMDSVPIPEIKGLSITPPLISFAPNLLSTFANALLLGLICAALRSVYRYRYFRHRISINYWLPCASSVISIALVIAILASVGAYVGIRNQESDSPLGMVEVIPCVVSIAYSALFGANVNAKAVTEGNDAEEITTLFDVKLNVYRGMHITEDTDVKSEKMRFTVKLIVLAVVFVIGALAGFIAVRKKSQDGPLATALRTTLVQFLVVAALMITSNLLLVTRYSIEEFSSVMTVQAACFLAIPMLIAFVVYGVGSMLGSAFSYKTAKMSLDL